MAGTPEPDRREFLKEGIVGIAMAGLGVAGQAAGAAPEAGLLQEG